MVGAASGFLLDVVVLGTSLGLEFSIVLEGSDVKIGFGTLVGCCVKLGIILEERCKSIDGFCELVFVGEMDSSSSNVGFGNGASEGCRLEGSCVIIGNGLCNLVFVGEMD